MDDLGERELLRTHHVHVFTMSDIDQRSISNVMRQALSIAGKARDGIHLSLDMDALDRENATALLAVELVMSALGKKII